MRFRTSVAVLLVASTLAACALVLGLEEPRGEAGGNGDATTDPLTDTTTPEGSLPLAFLPYLDPTFGDGGVIAVTMDIISLSGIPLSNGGLAFIHGDAAAEDSPEIPHFHRVNAPGAAPRTDLAVATNFTDRSTLLASIRGVLVVAGTGTNASEDAGSDAGSRQAAWARVIAADAGSTVPAGPGVRVTHLGDRDPLSPAQIELNADGGVVLLARGTTAKPPRVFLADSTTQNILNNGGSSSMATLDGGYAVLTENGTYPNAESPPSLQLQVWTRNTSVFTPLLSFNDGGAVTLDAGMTSGTGIVTTLDQSGYIVLATMKDQDDLFRTVVGPDGGQSAPFGRLAAAPSPVIRSIVRGSGGSFFVAGCARVNAKPVPWIVHIRADGTPEPRFGDRGTVLVHELPDSCASLIRLDDQERPVVVINMDPVAGQPVSLILRFRK